MRQTRYTGALPGLGRRLTCTAPYLGSWMFRRTRKRGTSSHTVSSSIHQAKAILSVSKEPFAAQSARNCPSTMLRMQSFNPLGRMPPCDNAPDAALRHLRQDAKRGVFHLIVSYHSVHRLSKDDQDGKRPDRLDCRATRVVSYRQRDHNTETERARPDVGVRELKARASEIVRNVRERRARYTITYRGKPVGVLIPLEQSAPEPPTGDGGSAATAWDELVRLGEEIGRGWQSPSTGPELLSEMRR